MPPEVVTVSLNISGIYDDRMGLGLIMELLLVVYLSICELVDDGIGPGASYEIDIRSGYCYTCYLCGR